MINNYYKIDHYLKTNYQELLFSKFKIIIGKQKFPILSSDYMMAIIKINDIELLISKFSNCTNS